MGDKLKKLFRKPYIIKIILGLIITIVCYILSLRDTSILGLDVNVSEKILLIVTMCSSLFFVLIPIVLMVLNKELSIIKKVQEKTGLTDDQVIEEYVTADKFGKLWMSDHFTFTNNMFTTTVIPNDEIVWIYERVQIQKGQRKVSIVVRTVNKKEYTVNLFKEKNAKDCMEKYTNFSHIIIGYNKELDKLYKYHFAQFLDEQYNREYN